MTHKSGCLCTVPCLYIHNIFVGMLRHYFTNNGCRSISNRCIYINMPISCASFYCDKTTSSLYFTGIYLQVINGYIGITLYSPDAYLI